MFLRRLLNSQACRLGAFSRVDLMSTTSLFKLNQNASSELNIKLYEGIKGLQLGFKSTDKCIDVNKHYPYVWLRDRCKCVKCFNPNTLENELSPIDLDVNLVPNRATQINDTSIQVVWNDGHVSEYGISDLVMYGLKHEIRKSMPHENEPYLWNRKKLLEKNGFAQLDYEVYMNDESIVDQAFKSILKYGAVLINKVPANLEELERVCQKLAPIQGSLFSSKSCVVTSNLEFADRAYTKLNLGVHTDEAYIKNTAGLESFHIIEKASKGGESILVDGFHCADELRRHEPTDFDMLCNTYVESEFYKPERNYMKAKSPIIELDRIDAHRIYFQIRFNIYNKLNVNHLSSPDILKFYKALDKFARILQADTNRIELSLNPDQVLIFNNFRLLHGRTSFEGKRTLVTAYMPYDEWLSNARIRNLTEE